MSMSSALSFDEENTLEDGGIVRTNEETSGGDVKYEWNVRLEGGRPPFDIVLKDKNGIILDSQWNETSENLSGEFYDSPSISGVIFEVVDETNTHVSSTFDVTDE